MNIRALYRVFLPLLACGPAWAQDAITPAFAFTSSTSGQGNFTVGFQFYTARTITVNELGKYDLNGGGLNEAAAVGLWKLDGTLLSSATVPTGTAGTLRNGCHYAPITAVELPPGGYILGTQTFAGGEPFSQEGTITPVEGLAWYGSRFLTGSALAFPSTIGTTKKAYFGPSLAFTSTRSTNLVQNAGFEATGVAEGGFSSVTTIPGWTLSGTMVLANDWDGISPHENWAAANQANWLSLQAPGTPPNATISQTIPTEAGRTYEYSFAYSALDDATARTWTLPCSFGGVARTITINSGHRGALLIRPWQVASGTFVASGPTATISFTGNQQRDGFYGPLIDQVWVGAVTNTTPRVQSGRWALDGTLQDAGGVNHGRMVGPEAYAEGFAGQALTLTGANHVDLGPGVVSTNAYTKVAWVKRSGGGNNNILSGDGTSSRHAFYAASGNGYRLAAGHNGAWTTVRDNTAIPDGAWTFVAVTYDRAAAGGTLRLYRNGHLAGGTPVAVNVAPPDGGSALLGGFNGSGNGWTGQIDEVGLYDRALSPAEIEQLFRDGLHGRIGAYARVPELADFELVYDLPIPTSSALGAAGSPVYSFNDSAYYTGEVSFDRLVSTSSCVPAGAQPPGGSASRWTPSPAMPQRSACPRSPPAPRSSNP
ncbi:MAG: LamG-like jellyroll fold domain-containing protein [Kiritimatiellia bacterium]